MDSPIIKQIEAEARALSEPEALDLVERPKRLAEAKHEKRPMDWTQFRGGLKLRMDLLEYQRACRAEKA